MDNEDEDEDEPDGDLDLELPTFHKLSCEVSKHPQFFFKQNCSIFIKKQFGPKYKMISIEMSTLSDTCH